MKKRDGIGHTLMYNLLKGVLWAIVHTIYNIRVVGKENLPRNGPALLICNHVSYVDGLILGLSVKRPVSFMLDRYFYDMKLLNWFFRFIKAIPVSRQNRREVAELFRRSREELLRGNVVCIFAEGELSRTGNLLSFKKGFKKIVDGLDVPIIPVHLDRLWGSIFSFKGGRFFTKLPRMVPYPVTVSIGTEMPPTSEIFEIRQAVLELGRNAVQYKRRHTDQLQLRFLRNARQYWASFCMADSTGREMTYGKTLIGSLLLSRLIRKMRPQDSKVGVLLPPSVGGAITNVALLFAGKIPVNLNFTTGAEAMASAVKQCEMQTIITSRIFLEKAGIKEMDGMIYLEEVMKQITSFQKVWISAAAYLLPARLLYYLFDRSDKSIDSLATVIFSSGTTGIPKGVMLSHHNIISNILGLSKLYNLTNKDRIIGILPFFHSFGFTGTIWFPLLIGFGAVYHPNPMDAKTIGKMVFKYRVTILISTPTFLATYLRYCSAEDFSSLRFAVAGSEKLSEALFNAFKQKYGLDLLEGYGCTEMAPVISLSAPNILHEGIRQIGHKFGTVGHPIPGITAKVVDPDDGTLLPYGKEGLLLVKGPNRMIGYLGNPEKTAEVLKGDWYVTGDIASIDEDGFIRITDRLSRFSKIGGEMVPHLRIEEVVNLITEEQCSVVTAVPHERRGERLVLLHTSRKYSSDEIWQRLSETDLPKIWIPKRENIYCVETIPLLGTGKVNLMKAKAIAMEKVNGK
jgi:acyl-[acyl-carrier-protein]-phospholipid O-acyltransferase/long-chain-fatty-acid--[acyl-carrier-protein] ligase